MVCCEHLRREVVERAAKGLSYVSILLLEVRPTEISELDVLILVEENVLRLDVSMDDAFSVHML